ncbi:fumarylacetoacetate hydrolase family protein [Candidatus Bipolaricaulota bacterium]|nr:fumarylacetoacetate hydrolase family protein [Candidatus Bipolaricaulota bacterium]
MRYVRFLPSEGKEPLAGKLCGQQIIASRQNYALSQVRLLAPCTPTKIICLGRNYAAHAQELGNEVPVRPLLFFKPPSAIIGPEDDIILPPSPHVDYEAELAIVIGCRCRNVPANKAMNVISGYTCMNDVSDREAQGWDKNWVRAKGFDTSAPLGPVIITKDEIQEPFHIQLRLNGETRQDATTSQLIFSIPEIIEEITSFMTLEEGDVIATGTPSGVGPLSSGDLVEVEIEGIGTLRNRVCSPAKEIIDEPIL